MREAAAGQRFEEAARWRDLLRTLEDIRQRPQAIDVGLEDLDAVGYRPVRGCGGPPCLLHEAGQGPGFPRDVRRGDGRDARTARSWPSSSGGSTPERRSPRRSSCPSSRPTPGAWRRTWPAETERRTRLIVPKAGKYARLIEMANRTRALALGDARRSTPPLLALARVLGLAEAPWRIEGFDISNTGGDESVGSLVVFDGGVPNKDEYRKFKIRTVEGPNDVASLREVVRRRYARLKEEGKPMPGLILVDGGKPQLAAALKALGDAGVAGIPVISLAKREEIIFTPAHRKGIRLDRTSPALKLVEHVRDEAHRFAIAFHRKRRDKKSFASALDGIPGLGPKRKAALLARYGSLEAIRAALLDDLIALVGKTVAAGLKARLVAREKPPGP